VDRSKRALVEVGDAYLGSYFMDDRAWVTALLQAARLLGELGQRPAGDVYLVFTTNEEIGAVGGSYASGAERRWSAEEPETGELTLALEVGPTAAEYSTKVSGGPIIAYCDALCVNDRTSPTC
jgi:putative aminopeptidase FrvX